jgi:hypothetical protein
MGNSAQAKQSRTAAQKRIAGIWRRCASRGGSTGPFQGEDLDIERLAIQVKEIDSRSRQCIAKSPWAGRRCGIARCLDAMSRRVGDRAGHRH